MRPETMAWRGAVFLSVIAVAIAASAVTGSGDSDPEPTAKVEVANAGSMGIKVWHDDHRDVTCWLSGHLGSYGGQSISCMPDWMLIAGKRPPMTAQGLAQ